MAGADDDEYKTRYLALCNWLQAPMNILCVSLTKKTNQIKFPTRFSTAYKKVFSQFRCASVNVYGEVRTLFHKEIFW